MVTARESEPARADRRRAAVTEPLNGRPMPAWDTEGTEPYEAFALADSLRQELDHGVAADSARAPLVLVEALAVLLRGVLTFDAADPGWPDRDRLVLSPDQEALLLPVLQLAARAGFHDERFAGTVTDGASRQIAQAGGLGVAVGLALAERLLASRFGRSLVDHRTYALTGGAELTQGVSHEAASLAGLLRLDRLTVLWHDTGDAAGRIGADDTLRRFAAYGWATRAVDATDPVAIAAGLGMATRSRKPTLLACRGEPKLEDDRPQTRRGVGGALATKGSAARRGWLKRLAHHPRRAEFERAVAGVLPATLPVALTRLRESLAVDRLERSTAEASDCVVQALLPALPDLVGLTADLGRGGAAPAVPTGGVMAGFGARWLALGAREQGMAAALDGLAAHGGLLPIGVTLCPEGEALRPALWRAARLGLRAIHILTCDGSDGGDTRGGLGADQLAALRALPNLLVLHPADALETAECWEIALRNEEGPSLLVLSREPRPPFRTDSDRNCCERGGYVLAEAQGPRSASLIATGAAVAPAMAARSRLAADRIFVAVISIPCWTLFARAASEYRAEVFGEVARFGVDGGTGFGWERWLGEGGVFIGGSAEGAEAGLSADAIASQVRAHLAAP